MRDPASGGVPRHFGARRFAAAALALLVSVPAAPRPAGAAPAPAGAPTARGKAPAAQTAPLEYPGLAWNAGPREVAAALAARAYRPDRSGQDGRPAWSGTAFGRGARLTAEFDASSRLLAVTVRFAPDTRGSDVQRYAALVEEFRRRYGAWTAQVEPGRPVSEERRGPLGTTRRFGPRTAATMWTNAEGAAAEVQLDGESVLWARFESPRWNDPKPGEPSRR